MKRLLIHAGEFTKLAVLINFLSSAEMYRQCPATYNGRRGISNISSDKTRRNLNMTSAPEPQIRWYRTGIAPDVLEALNRKDDVKGTIQSAGHLGVLLMTGGLSVFAYFQSWWMLLVASLFVHGTVCAFLANACHEFVHGTVFNNRGLNGFFLYVFSFIRWFPPEYYWRYHTAHHQFTLYPAMDKDVELFPYEEEPGELKKVTLKEFFTYEFVNPLNLLGSIRRNLQHSRGKLKNEWETQLFASRQSRQEVFVWSRVLLAGHAGIAIVSLYYGYWIIPVVLSLTPCYGGWLQLLCNHPQHAGLKKDVPDFRLSCRTNYLNPVFRFLYWYMNYHIEHHTYAAVPCYNLGKLHELMKHDLPPVLNGLFPVWEEIIAIQYRQKHEPGYSYAQPLPDETAARPVVAPPAAPVRVEPLEDEIPVVSAELMRVWQCSICGFIYSEALGLPGEGIAPGTHWDSIPDDWVCPDCGTSKSDFQMQEVTVSA